MPTSEDGFGPEPPAMTPGRLDAIRDAYLNRLGRTAAQCMVCTGSGCVATGAHEFKARLEAALRDCGLQDRFAVVGTGCNGFCARGPIMVVQPEGIFYQDLTPDVVQEFVEAQLKEGKPLEQHLYRDADTGLPIARLADIPFFNRQKPIVLRNRSRLDPEDISSSIALGGYRALERVLAGIGPEEVISRITQSGLRGRGGGGFPTGRKWASGRAAHGDEKFVVCNADEGDPGAYMDRSILESDPHAMIEGMAIGAWAVGANLGFVYVRDEYRLARRRLNIALEQARAEGLLGRRLFGTDFHFDILVVRGAGAFVCGESTALMASIEGKIGEPRAKYVHTVERGVWDKPSVLNNVETWANVPPIIVNGAEWFRSTGTEGSKGTKVFSLVGKVKHTGLVEVPMGSTLREIVMGIGGGVQGGRPLKAVQTGGPSGGCIPEKLLDLPVDFDRLVEAGSMMGSGGMIVMDDTTCMVDMARYFLEFLTEESCGKCVPCREGIPRLVEVLERICDGEGRMEDIALLAELSAAIQDAALCGLGTSSPNPLLSTLKYFRDEYEAHISEGRCPAGVCKALTRFEIAAEKCIGCGLCSKACPASAISGEKKKPHLIDQELCVRCGSCRQACRKGAILVKGRGPRPARSAAGKEAAHA